MIYGLYHSAAAMMTQEIRQQQGQAQRVIRAHGLEMLARIALKLHHAIVPRIVVFPRQPHLHLMGLEPFPEADLRAWVR